MKISLLTTIVLAMGLMPLAADSIHPSCPHGNLSARFCDNDNDLLADPEQNPERWLDPYALIFGYTENQDLYHDAQEALKKHIEKVTGKHVKFFIYKTNAAQLEAMRNGMLHIVSLNTGSVPIGVRCSGFRLFAMAAKADKSYGYTMQIITYPGSGINDINDIKNETVLFVTPTSNSGYKAPHAILKNNYHLHEGIDYHSRFSGSHTKSLLKVVNKKAKIAAVASGIEPSLVAVGEIQTGSVKVIYTSKSFPGTGFGYPYNLKPELAKKIEDAFLTFAWKDKSGKNLDINKYHDALFIPAQYKEKWSLVRAIDQEGGSSDSCE
jgi:phosphonate transport system substrate-binding protein